jgi:predicted MFS family arabinose efflux permease
MLALAGFASMVSMRLCDAMLPAIAQTFGTQPGDAARVISAFAVAYGLLQLAYGPLGDRLGKPLVISMATFACSAGAVAAALSPTLDALTWSRVVMGAGAAGIIPLAMAWIGDQVPYSQRQEVLARLLGSTVLGMMVGSWAGGILAETLGWRVGFFALALLFAGVGVALRVGHVGAGDTTPRLLRHSYLAQIATVIASPWSRRLLAIAFVEGALVFGALAFVPSYLHDRFQLPLAEGGGVLALFGLGGLLYSQVAGRLLRRLGAPVLAAAGAMSLASAFLVLATMPHWGWSLPACLVAGLGFYMLHNTLQTCATQLSSTARGTAVSLFVCALFLGQSVGVAGAAWCFGKYSTAVCFGIAAPALLLLGAYFAWRLRSQLTVAEAVA